MKLNLLSKILNNILDKANTSSYITTNSEKINDGDSIIEKQIQTDQFNPDRKKIVIKRYSSNTGESPQEIEQHFNNIMNDNNYVTTDSNKTKSGDTVIERKVQVDPNNPMIKRTVTIKKSSSLDGNIDDELLQSMRKEYDELISKSNNEN